MNDRNIEELIILKLNNLYRTKYHTFKSSDQEIKEYIHTFPNEFALGTTAFDTGDNPTRLSHDEVVKIDKKKSYGGFYNSLLSSQKIIDVILSNEKSEKHKNWENSVFGMAASKNFLFKIYKKCRDKANSGNGIGFGKSYLGQKIINSTNEMLKTK